MMVILMLGGSIAISMIDRPMSKLLRQTHWYCQLQ